MRERRVTVDAEQAVGRRHCSGCDVTWRGSGETTCWFCGSPGILATHTRLIEDESAA